MAGSQNIGEASDNPVAINVTAMVDVIFCLCIFFMCSFHFKQLEGKIETWLPKDKGVFSTRQEQIVLEEIRVIFRWRDGQTVRKVGSNPAVAPDKAGDQQLISLIESMAEDYRKNGKTDFPVKLDSWPDVPWRDVIHVMDLCKERKIDKIEFAQPIEAPPSAPAH